ncbi:MAG: hypothetical protein SF187_16120 [Deltaproteobacteria bacterium]|nr:hypothetical protein [Deltaproteobacteria bacterium]
MLTSTTLTKRRFARSLLLVTAALGAIAVLVDGDARAAAAGGKHYFQVVEVKGDVPEATRGLARELLEKELAKRDQFTGDLGGVPASGEALKARGMRGFDVSLRFESTTNKVDEPKPGKRGKQLTVGTRITVFGSEIPDKRLAFSGEGESTQIAEVDERRIEKETKLMTSEVLGDAIRQAVDQAVLKLSVSKARAPELAPKKRKTKKAI